MNAWVESEKPRGLGLALFSSTPLRMWQDHFLPVRVQDHLAFEPAADVAPLLRILDDYERYAVALVDTENARLFTVFLGEIEEGDQFKDFVPPKHDQGGLSQANFQRHHEAHVQRHLDRVARRLAELARERRFDRLILAGPEEATSELRRRLSRALAARVVGVIPARITANSTEILGRTLEIETRAEHEHEARLLSELIDESGPAGRAICGIDPTLEALSAGQVMTLVVAERIHRLGSECPTCGRLEQGSVARCRICGGEMRPVHDLFHRAMARALAQAASVEVVHADAALRLVEVGAGMGAFLRFRPKT